MKKYHNFLSEFFFLVVKFSIYLNRRVFVMTNGWQAELATLSQKGGNSVTHLAEYILNLYNC